MKTNLITLSVVFLAATVMSCRNTSNSETSGESDPAMVTYDTNGYPIDSSANSTNDVNSDAASSTSSKNTQNQQNSNRSGGESASSNTSKSANQYSAPDGTNDENNDGDYYTKNNDKPMPSGTPIK